MNFSTLNDSPAIRKLSVDKGVEGAQLVEIFYRRAPDRVPHKDKSSVDWMLLNLSMGFDFDGVEQFLTRDLNKALELCYIKLGEFYTLNPGLEDLYLTLQGEMWSPQGQARELIKAKGLRHTSMSVGDIIFIDSVPHFVDGFGFEEIKRG